MENKTGIKKGHAIIILILLVSSFIWNGVFLSKNNSLKNERNLAVLNADSLLSAKLQLHKQIDDAKTELDACLKAADQLGKLNPSLNDEIKMKTTLIEKLTKDNASVSALRKQLKDAKKQQENYESQMNSLTQKIQELENKIAQCNQKEQDLINENELLKKKLELAKDVKARTISVMSYKADKSKTKPTWKAKKANRISATVDLLENQLADAGSKKVYLVVYSGGIILSDGNTRFTDKKLNSEMAYSAMKEITYNNSDQKVVVNYDFEQKLSKGKYKVEVYVDGSLAGKTDFTLK